MKEESEKVHSCGQSMWVESWVGNRRIFFTAPPDKKQWIEHCPKCGARLSLKDLSDEREWKWE
jgi:hypothetical protein